MSTEEKKAAINPSPPHGGNSSEHSLPQSHSEKSMSKKKELFDKMGEGHFFGLFPTFKPRYVWENGVVGSKYKYVGVDHEHKELWSSLFLDLVFVAMCSKIAHLFLECHYSGELIVVSFCTFQIFFNVRNDNDTWMMSFGADDMKHRIFNLAYVFGIVLMVLNIGVSHEDHSGESSLIKDAPASLPNDDDHHRRLGGSGAGGEASFISSSHCYLEPKLYRNFMGGFLIVRCCWMVLCASAMNQDKSKGILWQFGWKWIARLVSVIAFLIGAFAVTDVHQKAYILILVSISDPFAHMVGVFNLKALQLKWVSKSIMHARYPINYLVIQQRMAVFVLIVLGEGIIALLLPKWDQYNPLPVFMITLFGLTLLYNLSMQYFDLVLRDEGEMHAMRRDMLAGSLYFILQPYLGYFLLIMAGGIYILLVTTSAADATEENKNKGKLMVTLGVGLASLTMIWLRSLHKGLGHRLTDTKHILHLCCRLIGVIAHFILLASDMTPLRNLITHSMLTFWPFVFEGIVHLKSKKGDDTEEKPDDKEYAAVGGAAVTSSADSTGIGTTISDNHDTFWNGVDEFGNGKDAAEAEKIAEIELKNKEHEKENPQEVTNNV